MNREPSKKSMGFFAILKEAYKLTNKKFFTQITLTIPFAMFYIQISTIIDTKTYPQIDYGLTQSIYLILALFLIILSTYNVMYTIARFYNSKDITCMKVIGFLGNCWESLIFTLFYIQPCGSWFAITFFWRPG